MEVELNRTSWTGRATLVASLFLAACQPVGARRPPAGPSIPVMAEAAPVGEAAPAVGARVGAPGSPASDGVTETRGLWVVRTTMVHPDSVRAMVARAAGAGFNTVLVQVRGRGDAYYSGGIEPRADDIRNQPAFDPLALTISEAHARGIEVHAWLNVHLISSASVVSRDPAHLVNQRPDLLAVPRELAEELYYLDPRSPAYRERLLRHARTSSNGVEGLYSSPSDPEVKQRVYDVATDLVERYEIDGIHLDYVRYPNREYDYSRGALDRFRTWIVEQAGDDQRSRVASASARGPFAFVQAFPEEWAQFRRNHITDLVEKIYVGVKLRRPEVLVSAAVFPDARESFLFQYQDWEGWLRREIIDVVAPMAYNADDDLFDAAISRAAEVAGPQRVWAGVGAYRTTYEGTVRKIDIAQQIGVRGFLLFSYDWSVASGAATDGQPFLERVGRAARAPTR